MASLWQTTSAWLVADNGETENWVSPPNWVSNVQLKCEKPDFCRLLRNSRILEDTLDLHIYQYRNNVLVISVLHLASVCKQQEIAGHHYCHTRRVKLLVVEAGSSVTLCWHPLRCLWLFTAHDFRKFFPILTRWMWCPPFVRASRGHAIPGSTEHRGCIPIRTITPGTLNEDARCGAFRVVAPDARLVSIETFQEVFKVFPIHCLSGENESLDNQRFCSDYFQLLLVPFLFCYL